MSLTSFVNLMTHKVDFIKLDRNYKGDWVQLSSKKLDGFVEYGNIYTSSENGEVLHANAIVYLDDTAIPYIDIHHENYKINQTFPYTRNDLEVLKIDPIDDPRTGLTHHFEIYVR